MDGNKNNKNTIEKLDKVKNTNWGEKKKIGILPPPAKKKTRSGQKGLSYGSEIVQGVLSHTKNKI